MAISYPKDRFDDVPENIERVGAHRAPRRRGRGWIAFVWATVATIVLVGIGVVGLFVLNDRLSFGTSGGQSVPQQAESPTPTAPPTLDPSLTVTVLNGTTTAGIAGTVGDLLASQGWTVAARSNASTEDIVETLVYYADPAHEGAARGVAAALPGAGVTLSADFKDSGANLVVVVGSDYVPPAG
ncbi:LytR C-terminal domain-containing protein [Luethyella okanaganae]|uniref:LytR C-terminal domain-containing protein n=1 Tax=Luethyella okanaganae TaxID=69372 RepID=A0ABW1VJR4_9MICO